MGIFRWSLSLPIVIRQCIKITKLPTSLYTSKYVHLCLPFMQYPLVASSQVPLNICLTFDQMQLQASSLSDQSENTSCGWKNPEIYFHKFGLNCLEISKNCSRSRPFKKPKTSNTEISGSILTNIPTPLLGYYWFVLHLLIKLKLWCQFY